MVVGKGVWTFPLATTGFATPYSLDYALVIVWALEAINTYYIQAFIGLPTPSSCGVSGCMKVTL